MLVLVMLTEALLCDGRVCLGAASVVRSDLVLMALPQCGVGRTIYAKQNTRILTVLVMRSIHSRVLVAQ